MSEFGGRAKKRVEKELEKFQSEENLDEVLRIRVVADDLWHVTLIGANGTLFYGESFTLQVKFNNDYPIDSPEVLFIGTAPVHPHIYSNGHICLNILYEEWSPALTVKSLCLSILSMLSRFSFTI